MNYMQYNTQPQGGNNRPAYNLSNGWNNRIRPVSSIEEVRAASIDFDGSVFYFPDLANSKIYTKQINLDGTAALNMYVLQEIPVVTPQPVVDTSNFVTRQEFEQVIEQLKGIAVGVSQNSQQPVQNVTQPVQTVTEPIAAEKPSFKF